MTTFAKFFGCDSTSTTPNLQVRDTNNQQPITLEWTPTPENIQAEVAFDNVNFIEAIGAITNISGDIWQLEYNPKDRPTNSGLVTYRFTDNNDNVETLQIEFIGQPVVPETPGPLSLSPYGPKRVKTKQMEIEQFDIEKLQRVSERNSVGTPCFGKTHTCIGETEQESYRNRR